MMPSLFGKMLFLWRAVSAFHEVLTPIRSLSRCSGKGKLNGQVLQNSESYSQGFFPPFSSNTDSHTLSAAYCTFMAKMFYIHLHWCLCWQCWGNTFWLRTKSLEPPPKSMSLMDKSKGCNSFLNKQQKQKGLHPACFLPNCHVFENLPERVQYSFPPKTLKHYSSLLTAFPI